MSQPVWQPSSDRAARLLGLGGALAGALLLRWQLLGTLEKARTGAASLEYSLALIALGALWLGLGLFWLVRGLAGYRWVLAAQHDRRTRYVLIIAAATLVGLVQWYLTSRLSALGYAD